MPILQVILKELGVLDPKLFIFCAWNETALKKDHNPLMVSFFDLKVQVGVPIFQLLQVQRPHVEIGPLDFLLKFGPFVDL